MLSCDNLEQIAGALVFLLLHNMIWSGQWYFVDAMVIAGLAVSYDGWMTRFTWRHGSPVDMVHLETRLTCSICAFVEYSIPLSAPWLIYRYTGIRNVETVTYSKWSRMCLQNSWRMAVNDVMKVVICLTTFPVISHGNLSNISLFLSVKAIDCYSAVALLCRSTAA